MADDPDDGVPLTRVESGEQRVVVQVGGEMDVDRAPMLREALRAVITRPECPGEVVVDLSELTFCDSSGLNALLQARITAQRHGRRLSLRAPSPRFVRLLELTDTAHLFPITTH
ncbi:STAS domain-containing protein [Streptomyces sp. NPDC048269]|uniref:STAS domain-containing protein n=1 Tax=Streptomyces sp. NPDC048269 TaxID=3155753 RepID=UPI003435AC35